MIVEVRGLRKAYGPKSVLAGIDLDVAEGTVFALLGPNGAGKTTTVRILSTLVRPDAGTVRVAGHDVVRDPVAVRRSISLTGQYAAVDDGQTARENLFVVGRLLHLGRSAARHRAAELLARFDLLDAADRRVGTYSGGMRRRLDLAMGLVGRPRVVFLDEPTTGLDPTGRTTMWAAVRELVATGTTIVLTTQYLEEADRLADRISVVDGGVVVAAGTADELKARVGGDRLDLEFADPHTRDAARRVLGGRPDPDRPALGLLSDGSAGHLHHVLDTLRANAIDPVRVTSHRPTLDDVFRAVTTREEVAA
ncbi:daunorubicin resistance protein DrrA family ABC transporter ATP-binding protein [Saccharothrix violaceirubra]|uniref:ABC-2 type transport system ATP-binding protein n=1 Tax=Saccharothrix violaceirubra TaxID=413306 RepID=A0A7W7WVM9_9PSEU|nr:ATP-binding cassette domain-containing protein [Saccharothrix violaceirubra]MBB4965057.1 ABC-2 type transport system ATP-binding protein [Saccharothrix violaceirubra]